MAAIMGPGSPQGGAPARRFRPPMHGDPQRPPVGGGPGGMHGDPPMQPHMGGGGQITGDPQQPGGQPQVVQQQANDMYRSALLRRAQGSGSPASHMGGSMGNKNPGLGGGMSTGQGMNEQGGGQQRRFAPPRQGGFGQRPQQDASNPLTDMLRSRTSRRVMKGMGPGGR